MAANLADRISIKTSQGEIEIYCKVNTPAELDLLIAILDVNRLILVMLDEPETKDQVKKDENI